MQPVNLSNIDFFPLPRDICSMRKFFLPSYYVGIMKILIKQFPLVSFIRSRSYSQFWEDRFLSRIIAGQKGSYVDIGAGTPIWGSNTYAFYKAKWCGVTVDPLKNNMVLHKIIRPRDKQYQSLVSSRTSTGKFYELDPWELSTLDEELAQQRIKAGSKLIRELDSNIIKLEEIYSKNDFIRPAILSVDVEGAELDVLESNNWDKYKPDLICIEEILNPLVTSEIRKYLGIHGYSLIIYNGVSSIYALDGSDFIFE